MVLIAKHLSHVICLMTLSLSLRQFIKMSSHRTRYNHPCAFIELIMWGWDKEISSCGGATTLNLNIARRSVFFLLLFVLNWTHYTAHIHFSVYGRSFSWHNNSIIYSSWWWSNYGNEQFCVSCAVPCCVSVCVWEIEPSLLKSTLIFRLCRENWALMSNAVFNFISLTYGSHTHTQTLGLRLIDCNLNLRKKTPCVRNLNFRDNYILQLTMNEPTGWGWNYTSLTSGLVWKLSRYEIMNANGLRCCR
jgi:hypothetical protein